MSTTRNLLEGVAQYLEDQGLVTYAPSYTAGQTAVFFKELPPSPDRAVALTAYAAQDEAAENLSTVRVQFWFRGVPDNSVDVDDLADSVFAALQGLTHKDFGVTHVVHVRRVSSVQLGVDASKRCERTDNYAFDVNTPSTSGRPE